MAGDDEELTEIEIEMRDDHDIDAEGLDPVALDRDVRRILVRDEARIISVASVGLIAVGTVFSIAWLFLAWRIEQNANVFGGNGGVGDTDVVDRIIALAQVSSVLTLSLLLVAAGCGLRLYASRLFTAADG